MATSHEQRRITKRSPNACSRCRRQKIKCSGLHPCASCARRNLFCIFDDRENKILVTQGYLSDLQAKLARLEQGASNNVGASSSHSERGNVESIAGVNGEQEECVPRTRQSSAEGTRESSPRREQTHPDGIDLTNPLIESPSKYMSSSTGRSFYLGTSSNWSFHGQILNLVHEHIHKSPLPGEDLLFDGSAYDLSWDGSRSVPNSGAPVIPSIDYAIFLINAVKFHCSQLVHLFDEDEFMFNLHAFYDNTEGDNNRSGSLWYIHFLLIIAFGKTFVQHKHHAPRPPGADFFAHAVQLLPDTNRLYREPVTAVEILCCIALYFQALDSRTAAHVTIGQAMRIGLAQGMHTDMPIADLGEGLVQRCRKIWWTVYILDRQMTSLMGLPQSIQDEDISCRLPTFSGSAQRAAALNMQIKLARIYAEISRTVYGSKGRLRRKFVVSIKAALDNLTPLAEELRNTFPLHADDRFGGISRMPAHLHLLYYQSIVFVTRPLLFCCLKKVFDSPQEVEPLVSSRKVRHLLHMSLEASQKILNILEKLQDQGLLETFLPWDLDSLFVSTMVFILTQFVDSSLLDGTTPWLSNAFAILDTMISSGNRIAEFRVCELRKLHEMLAGFPDIQPRPSTASTAEQTSSNGRQMDLEIPMSIDVPPSTDVISPHDTMPTYSGFSDESGCFGDDLTAEQILAVAESMEIGSTDWLSFTSIENYQMTDGPDM